MTGKVHKESAPKNFAHQVRDCVAKLRAPMPSKATTCTHALTRVAALLALEAILPRMFGQRVDRQQDNASAVCCKTTPQNFQKESSFLPEQCRQ